MQIGNIFANLTASNDAEQFEELLNNNSIRIERIVSLGHSSPPDFWYDQSEDEWVILLKGGAKLLFENEEKETILTPGSFVAIPAHTKHRLTWTDPNQETVWLAIHYQK